MAVELQNFKKLSEDHLNGVVVSNQPQRLSKGSVSYEDGLKELDGRMKNMAKMLCLAVAYSANIGGMATLTGTPPNLVLDNVAGEYVFICTVLTSFLPNFLMKVYTVMLIFQCVCRPQ